MMNLSSRLTFMAFLTWGVLGALAYQGWMHLSEYQLLNQQQAESLRATELVLKLSSFRPSNEIVLELQQIRKNLTPEHRAEALSQVIQKSTHKQSLKKVIPFFFEVETEFRNWLTPQITYLLQRLVFEASLFIAISFCSLFLMVLLVSRSVFRPLKDLGQKMQDFLFDKYTYQFSVPEPTEIGQLQATFNSLAQRVLSNMEELRSLDQAKSDFLSIASHELRTPLTSIKGSLSLMQSGIVGKMNEPTLNLMNIALTETDRLIRLINDLLDLAKIEAKKFPLQKEFRPLSPLLQATVDSLTGLAAQAEVTLVISRSPEIEVLMDEDRIRQVLTNLVSNAIKFSPPKTKVTIEVEITKNQQVEFNVIDQGKGISPEDQDLIFQKFRQVTGPNNPLVKGTGLGLSIAKALVEEHQGLMGVESKVGQGSNFYFCLPDWRPAQFHFEAAA